MAKQAQRIAMDLQHFLTGAPSGLAVPVGTRVKVSMPGANYSIVGLHHEGVVEFLGVPFAAPPVLDLRWRSPQRYSPPAHGVIETVEPKPNCIQRESYSAAFSHPEWHSEGMWPTLGSGPRAERRPAEDCLYLNVFVPQRSAASAEDVESRLRPVFVWIPGGAGLFGGANDEQLDGRALAVQAHTVVVVGNYRLGAFGQVWAEALSDRIEDDGMSLSMQDQRMMLHWVQENIKAFGGDPKRVGLGGESSAAWDIIRHLLYPHSQQLFHRAVMSSPPSYFDSYDRERQGALYSLPEKKAQSDIDFRKFARSKGCTTGANLDIDVDCLLRVPAELLDPDGNAAGIYDPDPEIGRLRSGLGDGRQALHKVDVLMGHNRDDPSTWWGEGFSFPNIRASHEDFRRWTSRNYHGFGHRVFEAYRSEEVEKVRPGNGTSVWFRAASQAVLDQHFMCPAFAAAGAFRDVGLNPYIYRFDQIPKSKKMICSALNCDGTETEAKILGAGSCHGCDVPFWFQQDSLLQGEEELSLSNIMTAYLGNFLRTGDPNVGSTRNQSLPMTWPSAVDDNDRTRTVWNHWGPSVSAKGHLLRFGRNGGHQQLVDVEAKDLRRICSLWEEFADIEARRDVELTKAYWSLVALSIAISVLVSLAVFAYTIAGIPDHKASGPSSLFGGGPSSQSLLCSAYEDRQEERGFAQDRRDTTPSACTGSSDPYPAEHSVSQIFQQRAQERPSAVALELPGQADGQEGRLTLSYGALYAKVCAVAKIINTAGGRQGQTMAVAVERGVHLVVAAMSVLHVGGAWAALDLGAPEERQLRLLRVLKPSVVLLQRGTSIAMAPDLAFAVIELVADGAPVNFSTLPVERTASLLEEDAHPAMVVFTSGSTGEPKGVVYSSQMLTHGSWFYGQLSGLDFGQRTLLKSPHIWAVVEYELFAPLIRGATTLIAHPAGHKDPAYLARMLVEEGLDSWMITPRVLRVVLEELRGFCRSRASAGLRLQHCVCVGEALPVDLVDDFHDAFAAWGLSPQLHNLYGASEASCAVWSSSPETHRPGALPSVNAPAGQPQPHASFHVLQRQELPDGSRPAHSARPVVCGEVGEIFFGGVMSSGYLGRPEETAARFVKVEGIHGRLYATGDLGRIVNGQLEVLGRCDTQLNISGVRIEPGEVEAQLRRCSGVREAVVVAAGEPALLVAFFATTDLQASSEDLKRQCAQQLPQYMVPSIVIRLEHIPSLPNGKRDMRSLQEQANAAVADFQDAGQVILDSLGRARKQTSEQIRWQRAAWGCYAFWSYGVVVDHWLSCEPSVWACQTVLWLVPSWGELIMRSMGNVQDLCGFLMLGAYQDANDAPDHRTSLGRREFFALLIHLLVYIMVPIVDFLTPWQPGYPNWKSGTIHRWYLWMYVMARVFLCAMTKGKVPRWLQVVLVLLASHLCPESGFLDTCQLTRSGSFLHGLAFAIFPSYCETEEVPLGASATRETSTGLNDDGCTCAITDKPQLMYIALYLAFFHASPLIKRLPSMAPGLLLATAQLSGLAALHFWLLEGDESSGAPAKVLQPLREIYEEATVMIMLVLALILSGVVNWLVCLHFSGLRLPSAVLFLAALLSQVTTARFFYSMTSLESGQIAVVRTSLEVCLCCLQPSLFFVACFQLCATDEENRRSGARSWGALWFSWAVERAGKAALGCYIFHYFFTPTFAGIVVRMDNAIASAGIPPVPSGVLQLLWTMCVPAAFLFLLGPLFQLLLTGPVLYLAGAGRK